MATRWRLPIGRIGRWCWPPCRLGPQKWGSLTINGTESYKTLAVELAAEHGFNITNPELQDKLVAAGERIARHQRRARWGFQLVCASTR
ncbi:LPD7 domain-containing protein [Rhizobium beringeri]